MPQKMAKAQSTRSARNAHLLYDWHLSARPPCARISYLLDRRRKWRPVMRHFCYGPCLAYVNHHVPRLDGHSAALSARQR